MLGGRPARPPGPMPPPAPRPWHLAAMLKAADAFPMNLGFLEGQCEPGHCPENKCWPGHGAQAARGLGDHPGGHRPPPGVADALDVQVGVHTDTLNESGFVEQPRRLQGPHDPHLPHRRGRRRPCAGHHPGRLGSPMSCPVPPIRPALTPSTPSTSTWTCSWCAITWTRPSPRTLRLRSPASGRETIAAEDMLHDLGPFP